LRREFPGRGSRHPGEALVKVPVPAGRHEIRVDNLGSDWVWVSWFGLTEYVDSFRHPPIDVRCLRSPGLVLLWARNLLDSPEVREMGVRPRPVSAEVIVGGMEDGAYWAEFWDTSSGEVFRRERLKAAEGKLAIPLGSILGDVAVKCSRPATELRGDELPVRPPPN